MSILPCATLASLDQRIHACAAIAMIALLTSAPLQAAQPAREVIGDWRFTSVLDNVEITSIDDGQAKKLLGRVMTIRKEGTRFGEQTCGAPSLEAQRVEPGLYVRREAQIGAGKLRLPNPVTVVDLGCTHIFMKQADRAVIFWDGFFFDAVKIGKAKHRRHQVEALSAPAPDGAAPTASPRSGPIRR